MVPKGLFAVKNAKGKKQTMCDRLSIPGRTGVGYRSGLVSNSADTTPPSPDSQLEVQGCQVFKMWLISTHVQSVR